MQVCSVCLVVLNYPLITYFTLNSGSSPTVGSSSINSDGSWSSATANDTRLC